MLLESTARVLQMVREKSGKKQGSPVLDVGQGRFGSLPTSSDSNIFYGNIPDHEVVGGTAMAKRMRSEVVSRGWDAKMNKSLVEEVSEVLGVGVEDVVVRGKPRGKEPC